MFPFKENYSILQVTGHFLSIFCFPFPQIEQISAIFHDKVSCLPDWDQVLPHGHWQPTERVPLITAITPHVECKCRPREAQVAEKLNTFRDK